MRMQVILDSLFTRPGSAPIGGGKKGEFSDWTTFLRVVLCSQGAILHSKCQFLSDSSRVQKIL